jgi:hypothetical protein
VKHFVKAILIVTLAFAPVAGWSAYAGANEPAAATSQSAEAAAAGEEHGVPPKAGEVGRIGSFPITNSMIVTWIVAVGLIIFAQIATRNIQQVPAGAQNFWEWLVESLHNFLEGIIGHKLVFRHNFHLYSFCELGRPDSGHRHDWLWSEDRTRLQDRAAPVPWR